MLKGKHQFLESDCNEKYIYQVEKIILEETNDKLEWRKPASELELKNSYGIGKWNDLIHIHDKEVYKIAECSLLYNTINPPKHV